jgi:hypothetical protein
MPLSPLEMIPSCSKRKSDLPSVKRWPYGLENPHGSAVWPHDPPPRHVAQQMGLTTLSNPLQLNQMGYNPLQTLAPQQKGARSPPLTPAACSRDLTACTNASRPPQNHHGSAQERNRLPQDNSMSLLAKSMHLPNWRQPQDETPMETRMDSPLCLARVDIAPPKLNHNGRVLSKPQRKPWLTRALQTRDQSKT